MNPDLHYNILNPMAGSGTPANKGNTSMPRLSKTPPERVRRFRKDHGLDQPDMDRLLGFVSEGRTTRGWETGTGAPPYVELFIRYAEQYGLEVARTLADERAGLGGKKQIKTPGERVFRFRRLHNWDQAKVDRALGFAGQGRTSRRWENDNEAPPYVEVLLRYMERYGVDTALQLADERERK